MKKSKKLNSISITKDKRKKTYKTSEVKTKNKNRLSLKKFINNKSKKIKTLFNSKEVKKMLKYFLEDDSTHYKQKNRCMCIDYDIKNNDFTMENNLDYRRCKNDVMPGSNFCKKHQRCPNFVKQFNNSKDAIDFDSDKPNWEHPYVKGTHNCYSYFLNNIQDKLKKKCDKICRKKYKSDCPKFVKKCGDYKPQPGNHNLLMKEGSLKNKKRVYKCDKMEEKIILDNEAIKPISFNKVCPKNHYKGAMVVHDDKTFHFYRINKDGTWSHKPGTMSVTNLDADNNKIYFPHLANRDYSEKPNNINYKSFCNYYCIPVNSYIEKNSI